MTSLHTLAELIGEYEDELAACKQEFAEALRIERMRADLSLSDMEALTGMDRSAVSYIEGGRYRVTRETARKLADAIAKARRAG